MSIQYILFLSVENLTKKNYKASLAETSQLVALHGAEAGNWNFVSHFAVIDTVKVHSAVQFIRTNAVNDMRPFCF